MIATPTAEPAWRDALESCIAALRRMASYSLDPALDERLRDLGERKEFLAPTEHAELLALVDFTRQRSLEKLEAEATLRRLRAVCPELVDQP